MSLALGRGKRPHKKPPLKTSFMFKKTPWRYIYKVWFWDNSKSGSGWWAYKGTQTLPGETRKTLILKFEETL